MKCKLTLTVVLLLALVGLTGQTANAKMNVEKMNKKIESYINSTHHRQIVMGIELTPSNGDYKTTKSNKYRLWILRKWKKEAYRVMLQFRSVPNSSAWECIHKYEGSWVDQGAPYYGGLQMDITFQSRYGAYLLSAKGTANNWTPLEQKWVAQKAYVSGRGFYPWPNTARACGLI